MARSLTLGLAGLLLAMGQPAGAADPPSDDASANANATPNAASTPAADASADPTSVLGYTMNRIDGTPEPLSAYAGKVVLIVNTASRCGLTPQYKGLEALYRAHKDEGLVILGFPANDFAGQEPGTNDEIAEFCTTRFDVTFPMFEKIAVTGDEAHPLYQRLAAVTAELQGEKAGGPPSWNFTKYLIDRDGHIVRRFDPRTTPSDPALLDAVKALLASEPSSGGAAAAHDATPAQTPEQRP
jgi:glutathione peroxidase